MTLFIFTANKPTFLEMVCINNVWFWIFIVKLKYGNVIFFTWRKGYRRCLLCISWMLGSIWDTLQQIVLLAAVHLEASRKTRGKKGGRADPSYLILVLIEGSSNICMEHQADPKNPQRTTNFCNGTSWPLVFCYSNCVPFRNWNTVL